VTSELLPYPEYKDSGMPWLGPIPAHWDIRRLKWVCRLAYGDSLTADTRNHGGVAVYGSNGPVGYHNHANTNGPCVVIGRKGSFGKVRFSRDPVFAIDTTYFVDDRFTSSHIPWLYYALSWAQLDDTSRDSAVPGLDRYEAYTRVLPLPSLDEQKAIAGYLDAMSVKINRFIRNRRRLIEVLNEQKQAIINRAVTRGLDPNVPLKPSGVDWIGNIPEHWEVQRLKWLANIKTGGRDTIHRQDEGAYPFFVRSQTVERIDTYSFDGEAVLTAGDGAGVAKVFHYINGKFDYHQRVYKFSDFRRVLGKFFFHYFSVTLRFEAFRETAKSTVDSLRLPMLKDFPVVIPPLQEQKAIIAYVESQTRGLDQSIAHIRREIDLIREYRTRLIADVVTGKVDVRSLAPAEPPVDDELLDEAFDDEEMLADDESELVGEAADADD